MGILFTLILWFFFCGLVSYLSLQRGRDPTNWFFIAIFIGLFSLPLLYFLPKVAPENQLEPVKTDPLSGKDWVYLDSKRDIKGPFSYKIIRSLQESGDVTPETWVWSEGMNDWAQLSSFESV